MILHGEADSGGPGGWVGQIDRPLTNVQKHIVISTFLSGTGKPSETVGNRRKPSETSGQQSYTTVDPQWSTVVNHRAGVLHLSVHQDLYYETYSR